MRIFGYIITEGSATCVCMLVYHENRRCMEPSLGARVFLLCYGSEYFEYDPYPIDGRGQAHLEKGKS